MGDTALKRLQIGLEGGVTSGAASVYNGGSPLPATRRLAVEEAVGFEWDFGYDTPKEARGGYQGVYTHVLQMQMAKGKIPAYVYADDFCYLLRLAVSGAPTITTLPTTPTALLAATSIAASMTLTTQPNAAGDGAKAKILALTLSNAATNNTAVTATVTGTDINSNPLTEQVAFTGGTTTTSAVGGGTGALTVTLYTRNYFATVTSITTSVQPVGDQLAVGGVNGFFWLFPIDLSVSTIVSATGEYWDGSAAWQLPGLVVSKLGVASQIGKSFKADLTVMAQKKAALLASTGSINPVALSGTLQTLQNLGDTIIPAIPTYATRVYADPFGSTPGTTAVPARLAEAKFDIDTGVKLGKTADGTPFPNYVGREMFGDKVMGDFTLLFNSYANSVSDPLELQNFLNQASRVVRLAYPGPYLPCGQLTSAGGWPTSLLDSNSRGGAYGIQFDIAGKHTSVGEKKLDGRAAFSYKFMSEVDLSGMGVNFQAGVVSRINPNMS